TLADRLPRPTRKTREGRPRGPPPSLPAGDSPLGDHLPGEPLAVDGELVVVHPRCRLSTPLQILAVPVGVVLAATQPQTVEALRGRRACSGAVCRLWKRHH